MLTRTKDKLIKMRLLETSNPSASNSCKKKQINQINQKKQQQPTALPSGQSCGKRTLMAWSSGGSINAPSIPTSPKAPSIAKRRLSAKFCSSMPESIHHAFKEPAGTDSNQKKRRSGAKMSKTQTNNNNQKHGVKKKSW